MSVSCLSCHNGARVENGYSNWTVEGADFYCLEDMHPEAPFDCWYGTDVRLNLAEECGQYLSGEPVEIDVDQDTATAEDLARWKAYLAR